MILRPLVTFAEHIFFGLIMNINKNIMSFRKSIVNDKSDER
jgi:hypothetical protein